MPAIKTHIACWHTHCWLLPVQNFAFVFSNDAPCPISRLSSMFFYLWLALDSFSDKRRLMNPSSTQNRIFVSLVFTHTAGQFAVYVKQTWNSACYHRQILFFLFFGIPSVSWHCWLGKKKGIQSVTIMLQQCSEVLRLRSNQSNQNTFGPDAALVMSVLLYRAETWTVLSVGPNRLEVFHTKCQRQIFSAAYTAWSVSPMPR